MEEKGNKFKYWQQECKETNALSRSAPRRRNVAQLGACSIGQNIQSCVELVCLAAVPVNVCVLSKCLSDKQGVCTVHVELWKPGVGSQ